MPYWFDGNNLIGQSAAESRIRPQVQHKFLSALSVYRKAGGGRFFVYFDGDDKDRTMPPAGIKVRYSAPLSADKAIVRRLGEIRHPEEVIVVTNDRQLQHHCRNSGAKVLDWPQFILKMRSRKIRTDREKESDQSVDVDEWLKYFGLDE
jgi:predicted RNA-binding protein with PIN domain